MSAISDPYPGSPADGQSLEASIVLAKFNAIFSWLSSPDLSQGASKSVTETQLADAINIRLWRSQRGRGYVISGFTAPTSASLATTIASGIAYVNGYYVNNTGDGGHTYTASEDTYVDLDENGVFHYSGVANGASAPALTANSIRIAKIVTSGTAVTTVTQSGVDSNFIPIYALSEIPFSSITALFSTSSQTYSNSSGTGTYGTYTNLGGIKLFWGTTGAFGTGGTAAVAATINLPTGFFSGEPIALVSCLNMTGDARQYVSVTSGSASSIAVAVTATAGSTGLSTEVAFFMIGT